MKENCNRLGFVLFAFVLCFEMHAQVSMIADITTDVQTDFGTYHPYPADFTPNVPLFAVEPDFSNVENFQYLYGFSAVDSALLLQNHFTVRKSQFKQLYDIYNDCTWDGMPLFVTTDAVLHIYHVLYDKMLAEIEIQEFVPVLELLTQTLIDSTQSLYDQETDPNINEVLRRNLAFLCVSQKLLKGSNFIVPEPVSALVDSELTLINNHDGFNDSPIFGSFTKLDYSQFIPRGHYTTNDTLTAYFKSMMWQGWTIFTMEPELFGDLARRHTLLALLLTQMLYNLEADGNSLLDLWKIIYEPTVFFVGKTDDPNILHYKTIAEQVYGSDFLSLSAESLANSTLLENFMTEAQKLPEPKIPNWIYGTYITYKGFRFMGQRFIPDSYMFAHLIDPEVGARLFPKGLDMMAILGSDRAYDLLDSLYNETAYPNYPEKIAEFKAEFAEISPQEWAQNLYWNWLYCLMPLLYEKGEGYPSFMQTIAWMDKELLTALASWAELRHDTILYAKQSMTPCGMTPGPPKSYVEPNPHLYARLASLTRYTIDGLRSRNLLTDKFEHKLTLFETLLLFLRDVSIKELENTPLSESEYANIYCFGKVMQELVSDNFDPQNPWNYDSDNMAVVADVHTDSNTDQCLEEGVGYPLEINVIVNEGGTIRITRGAIFSYYEFIQPIADRLTDEAWREMLVSDTPPALPQWYDGLTDMTSSQPSFMEYSPDNLYEGEFGAIETEDEPQTPESFRLRQNFPNPFNPETTIQFELPEIAHVRLEIYNLLGQKIATLVDCRQPAGKYTQIWNGKDQRGNAVASGIYFYKLTAGDFVQVRKMILAR